MGFTYLLQRVSFGFQQLYNQFIAKVVTQVTFFISVSPKHICIFIFTKLEHLTYTRQWQNLILIYKADCNIEMGALLVYP